jgi:hypothetical protein
MAVQPLFSLHLEEIGIQYSDIYLSAALAGGRTLAEVRDAAGHCNVSITSSYLHVVVDEMRKLEDCFNIAVRGRLLSNLQ